MTLSNPDSPSARILRDAALADLALVLARWAKRHWNELEPMSRAQIQFALDSGCRNGSLAVGVPMAWFVEALRAMKRHLPR